jgi:hypothetical protein
VRLGPNATGATRQERRDLNDEIEGAAAAIDEEINSGERTFTGQPQNLHDLLISLEEFDDRPRPFHGPAGAALYNRRALPNFPDTPRNPSSEGTLAPLPGVLTYKSVVRRALHRMVNAVVQDLFKPPVGSINANITAYSGGFLHNSQRLYWKREVLQFALLTLVPAAVKRIREAIDAHG